MSLSRAPTTAVKAPASARAPGVAPGARLPSFVALDFETANRDRDSACAIAVVRVDEGRITRREHRLIRPPSRSFEFTYVHGITWKHVAHEPTFGEIWPSLVPVFEGASFIAAHNASFDRGVLAACCARAGQRNVELPYECTVKLARSTWSLYPTTLKHVADFLGLPLRHHDAASDAEACANIVLAAAAVVRAA
ncbi:MAG: 3'-5' exonuclease [Byssovorax sp.]